MTAIIITGPQGSGKTLAAEALAKHFKKVRIIDEWKPGDQMPANTLCLTNVYVPSAPNVWRIEDALQDMQLPVGADQNAAPNAGEQGAGSSQREPGDPTNTVLAEVGAERRRQIDEEGNVPAGDDSLVNGELAGAAACYTMHGINIGYLGLTTRMKRMVFELWPWSPDWWKPKDRRRDLIRAGALIVAEIERLDRATAQPAKGG